MSDRVVAMTATRSEQSLEVPAESRPPPAEPRLMLSLFAADNRRGALQAWTKAATIHCRAQRCGRRAVGQGEKHLLRAAGIGSGHWARARRARLPGRLAQPPGWPDSGSSHRARGGSESCGQPGRGLPRRQRGPPSLALAQGHPGWGGGSFGNRPAVIRARSFAPIWLEAGPRACADVATRQRRGTLQERTLQCPLQPLPRCPDTVAAHEPSASRAFAAGCRDRD